MSHDPRPRPAPQESPPCAADRLLGALGSGQPDRDGGRWYRLAGGPIYGAPPSPLINDELDVVGWRPPRWASAIYRAHDGVGPWWGGRRGWGHPCLLPYEQLRPLTARVRFGEENILFDPAAWVVLIDDGRGGGLACADADPMPRRFDAQRHDLGPPMSPYDAIDALLRRWSEP